MIMQGITWTDLRLSILFISRISRSTAILQDRHIGQKKYYAKKIKLKEC